MNRLKKIRQKARRRPLTIPVWLRYLGGIVVAALLIVAGFTMFPDDRDGYLLNLYTELAGVIVTIVFVNTFLYSQGEKRKEKDLKERLLREVRSPEASIARNAIYELQDRGLLDGENSILKGANLFVTRPSAYMTWFIGVKLKGIILNDANLSKINMIQADLEGAQIDSVTFKAANLQRANFSKSHVWTTDMRSANLQFANFERAYLDYIRFANANLEGANFNSAYTLNLQAPNANMKDANMSGTFLWQPDFEGACCVNADFTNSTVEGKTANVRGVNFSGADLTNSRHLLAEADETTILPNGEKWSQETDIEKFSDPKHPDYWRSDDLESPTYRGDPFGPL